MDRKAFIKNTAIAGIGFSLDPFHLAKDIHGGIEKKPLMPSPEYASWQKGEYHIDKHVNLWTTEAGQSSALFLQQWLKKMTALAVQVHTAPQLKKKEEGISFKPAASDSKAAGQEAYELHVEHNRVTIVAGSPSGFFYGVQTFMQLFPYTVYQRRARSFALPLVHIKDRPRFKWRSFMLDSGRQYQSVDFIKQYLDYLAMLKINVFHWHLTEGQGWRIEIKKYPKLTSIGSKVAHGKEQQGFYTQDEIREIVAYAKQRHITVVPEIDIPGHSEAALTAYPEYTCDGKPPKSIVRFSPKLFCAGNEKTYSFFEDVFAEVVNLFPSEYIHIGGDEAPKDEWDKCKKCQQKIKDEPDVHNTHDLQLYFTNRIAAILANHGRKAICWGDIVRKPSTVKLNKNIVINWWNWRRAKDKPYQEAIRRNMPVIAGTNYYNYLNFPVTPWSHYKENRTFGLKDVYENNPSDLAHPSKLMMGMGCYLWTDWHVLEYMIDRRVFPRIFAVVEQMWHVGARLSYHSFYEKVKKTYPWLAAMGIDYGPATREEALAKQFKWE